MMPFNLGYTSPGGLYVPDSTSSDDVPHVLQGLFDGSNGGANLNAQLIAGPFASVAALTSAFNLVPDSQKPALASINGGGDGGLGLYQWIPAPYSTWLPAYGATTLYDANPNGAVAVNSGSPVISTTSTIVVQAQKYPTIATVSYRALVTQTGGATSADTYVNVNGSSSAYQRVPGFPGSTSVSFPVRIPGTLEGGSATFSLTGGLQYNAGASGATANVDSTDGRYVKLSALVVPAAGNVGVSPF